MCVLSPVCTAVKALLDSAGMQEMSGQLLAAGLHPNSTAELVVLTSADSPVASNLEATPWPSLRN